MGGTGRTVPSEYLSCCVIIWNEGLWGLRQGFLQGRRCVCYTHMPRSLEQLEELCGYTWMHSSKRTLSHSGSVSNYQKVSWGTLALPQLANSHYVFFLFFFELYTQGTKLLLCLQGWFKKYLTKTLTQIIENDWTWSQSSFLCYKVNLLVFFKQFSSIYWGDFG